MNKISPSLILLIFIAITTAQEPDSNIETIEPQEVTPFAEQQVEPGQFELPEDHINDDFLQQVEEEAQQAQLKNTLNSWVADQLSTLEKIHDFEKTQSFMLHLQYDQMVEFKWSLAIPQARKKQFGLVLSVFTYEVGDDLVLNKNPAIDNYVQIHSKSDMQGHYQQIGTGTVYVEKAFTVTFQQDSIFLKVANHNEQKVVVQVDLQKQRQNPSQKIAEAIKNQHFELPSSKLQTIFQEFKQNDKSRTKMYKWEWGFLQREDRYDSQMLKLTGVELLVILATAVIQMYSIKSLMDHKRVI